MPSPCDPQYAPVGDVGTALLMVDSRLKAVHDGSAEEDPRQRQLIDQFTASMSPEEADDVLDGACTLVYLYARWLTAAYEDHGKDVVEYVVPDLVATMRQMPRSIRPEAIPTMAGMVIAAAGGLGPGLWRKQYGYWTESEMTPLEVTAFLLAERINHLTDDRQFATRLISNALSSAAQD
ncbi:hypothetical protein RVR_4272 [Actinacidiphila reveromycinica]|uniref:Uncharacterized protein n=1 Tax=Actinacidiphila reveromycinica TaxID=659352 RepID=D6RT92_9ACTN|nr:hypothetical protein [Streptomyces sp. SN-593]BAJ07992.1 hypothetical protein [Streptomyces sp. SN-593]BBA98180.1 hypothetical protein RVR_4272 [Streptomyces sp. SN-593]